jgi:S-formylglutathione hydrolase
VAPICAPSRVPWGEKAFGHYLGPDRSTWANHDTVALLGAGRRFPGPVLVDQGMADKFLDSQLRPDLLETAMAASGQPLTLRRHADYDHGYYFIQTVIDDHLDHHAAMLVG